MWKKDEEQGHQPTPNRTATTPTTPRSGPTQGQKGGFATIGPSIVIRGEVSGDEDLLIQGKVDGSVVLGMHAVTIGDGGRVKAGITGRVITVEGAVEGDLSAGEQIILRGTAKVKGDLNAPRVILEDGATFKGLIDMGKTPELDPAPEKPSDTSGSSKTTTPEVAKAEGKAKPGGGGPTAGGSGSTSSSKPTGETDKATTASGAGKSANG